MTQLCDYLKSIDTRLYSSKTGRKTNVTDDIIINTIKSRGNVLAPINEIARDLKVSHVRVRKIRKQLYCR